MSVKTNIAGVLPVFCTPFHEDGTLDVSTLEREIDWLFDQGVNGVVFAMVSEVLRLSDTERMAVAQRVCARAQGRGVSVISVGSESTHQACEFAQHAVSVGADALMAIPPMGTALNDEQIYDYYRQIVESVTIPVVVQDASGYLGRPISIAVQAQLWQAYGDRVMFKPEAQPIGPRLSQLRDATNGQANIFEGTGGLLLADSYRRGVAGTMPGADFIVVVMALWQALESGDKWRVESLSCLLTSAIAPLTSLDMYLAVEKHLLVRQGVFNNTIVRGPVGATPDAEQLAEIDRLFDRMLAHTRLKDSPSSNINTIVECS